MPEPFDPEKLREIARRHGIGLVVFFGSRARGTERPDSDLDLGVEREDGRRMTWRELAALQSDLTDASGVAAQVADLRAADAILRFEVVSHGRPLFEALPGRYKELVARTLIDRDDLGPFLDLAIAGVGRAARAGERR